MLSTVQDPVGCGYKVLVMDPITTRIMSSALSMSDILDTGVANVEDLDKAREPLTMAAVYFITPTVQSVMRLVADFQRKPLYPSVHIFFSSRASADAVEKIKRCSALLPVLKSLKEVNLEFLLVDGRTVSTEQPKALPTCMGERCESDRGAVEKELDLAAMRLSTLFATLNDFPAIRYKAGKIPEAGEPPGAAARSTLTQRLAMKISDRLMSMQRAGQLPNRETCDLIILDRSIDPVAPIIHEWTYETMVYDLISVDNKTISYSGEDASGTKGVRQHILDETDDLWVELRHSFIAEVYSTVSERLRQFQEKNKAAKYKTGQGGNVSNMSGGNIKALIQALPEYRAMLGLLSTHISISEQLKNISEQRQLMEVGELEQDIVYGEKSSQELIKYLADNAGSLEVADKMRLFLCYLATHPEKMDATKRQQWMRVARLEPQDMAVICNLAYLNITVMKQEEKQSKGLTFGLKTKKKKGTRAKRQGRDDNGYTLNRFDPVMLDVLEDAAANKLSNEEYPWVRGAPADSMDDFGSEPSSLRIASARTTKSVSNWARRGGPGGAEPSGYSGLAGGLGGLNLGAPGGGRRLVIFVLGGVTRSEMRVVHNMSKQLGRDIILASTLVLRPGAFLSMLRDMGRLED